MATGCRLWVQLTRESVGSQGVVILVASLLTVFKRPFCSPLSLLVFGNAFILPDIGHGCLMWSRTLRKKHKLKFFLECHHHHFYHRHQIHRGLGC